MFLYLRLSSILTARDTSTAVTCLKNLTKTFKTDRSATIFEIRQLDMCCHIAFGEGLERFIPPYFAGGVTRLRPGHFPDVQLPPLAARPMLRIVSDREKAANAAQGFLTSRLRALEVADPFHVLWRIALNGIKAAGCQGHLDCVCVLY
jgi:hypothetical protein